MSVGHSMEQHAKVRTKDSAYYVQGSQDGGSWWMVDRMECLSEGGCEEGPPVTHNCDNWDFNLSLFLSFCLDVFLTNYFHRM